MHYGNAAARGVDMIDLVVPLRMALSMEASRAGRNSCRLLPDERAPITNERGRPTKAASYGSIIVFRCYLRALDTLVNVVFNCVPRPVTTTMMATEIPAAIKPYSIAVAPDWSFRNLIRSRDTVAS
jgi:hypothetical protein